MRNIARHTLPLIDLWYSAFRISFQETLERIALFQQFPERSPREFGFLTEVPFLACVAPHVQLDLLAETWSKLRISTTPQWSLVDEAVMYAAGERASQVIRQLPQDADRFLRTGPLERGWVLDRPFAIDLRQLGLDVSESDDFLLISQFEDLAPEDALELKQELGMDLDRLEELFQVLGRWRMSRNFSANLTGLLTIPEQMRVTRQLLESR